MRDRAQRRSLERTKQKKRLANWSAFGVHPADERKKGQYKHGHMACSCEMCGKDLALGKMKSSLAELELRNAELHETYATVPEEIPS